MPNDRHRLSGVLALVLLALALPGRGGAETSSAAAVRGEVVFHAAACDSCHTDHPRDGRFLAGGRRMTTQFGTFVVPNITPDPQTGIGRWSLEDFRAAMIEGLAPDGSNYYPVFPYRWYTGMTEQDLADLWEYLRSVPPVHQQTARHELIFPFNIRLLIWGWKLLNFTPGARVADPDRSPAWNRGAYLVNHLGHCGACHTPSDLFGNFISWRFLAGSSRLPGPYPAPNITRHATEGLGGWSRADVVRALKQAIRPDGTPIVGAMAEYVISGTSRLGGDDLDAMAVYLETVEPHAGLARDTARDSRLAVPDGYSAGGSGSAGTALLRLSSGGLTRAK